LNRVAVADRGHVEVPLHQSDGKHNSHACQAGDEFVGCPSVRECPLKG
jgi:hypothetical protein